MLTWSATGCQIKHCYCWCVCEINIWIGGHSRSPMWEGTIQSIKGLNKTRWRKEEFNPFPFTPAWVRISHSVFSFLLLLDRLNQAMPPLGVWCEEDSSWDLSVSIVTWANSSKEISSPTSVYTHTHTHTHSFFLIYIYIWTHTHTHILLLLFLWRTLTNA